MFYTFGGMETIILHDDKVEIEQYFVTLFFDRYEIENGIYSHLSHEFSDKFIRQVSDEGAYFTTDLTLFSDEEIHDAINDLMYYHQLKPIQIKFINNEHK